MPVGFYFIWLTEEMIPFLLIFLIPDAMAADTLCKFPKDFIQVSLLRSWNQNPWHGVYDKKAAANNIINWTSIMYNDNAM